LRQPNLISKAGGAWQIEAYMRVAPAPTTDEKKYHFTGLEASEASGSRKIMSHLLSLIIHHAVGQMMGRNMPFPLARRRGSLAPAARIIIS